MSFNLAVKSTLDKVLHDIGIALSPLVATYDIDDSTSIDELLEGIDSALVLEFSSMEPDPIVPFYNLVINCGCKAVNSAANYSLLSLFASLEDTFAPGESFIVKDYSGATAGTDIGVILITKNSTNPQMFNKTAGFRMLTVEAKAIRHG